ncbi:hypothetical protein FRC14_001014 [Serendipita sp. 396]|nr:hypothetical protein FRC14_001014 [Serendipita sp. 396]KAG8785748.1 hypothetical protein FRC15_000767 [Serendipita sp. 397]KAG8835193.1 hypothetical protein FRC18_000869 [Serendipita sp. 400]KAG8856117.1 hypothetical protein FRB91_001233 [Serendipita sp. 411]KAG8870303.1 hypothetical protein FRC20_012031 [Serendipita sp. 405]
MVDIPLLLLSALIAFILWTIFQHPEPRNQALSQDSATIPAQPEANETTKVIEAFLVLDVEATCIPNGGFEEPNEIIEWPVILLRWDKEVQDDTPKRLVIVDIFHSYCRPILRPTLHPFCTELTGITQEQVDQAPTFPEVLSLCRNFMVKNELIDQRGNALQNYAWCTDGPWDLRDFLQKQAFISKIERPSWLRLGRVVDVRSTFGNWYVEKYLGRYKRKPKNHGTFSINPSFKLNKQLRLLDLEFEGREHSGLDDSRNIARVLIELAARGFPLEPNLDVSPTRTYPWMRPNGTVAIDSAQLTL